MAEAARGTFRLVWVIDDDSPEAATSARLLRRLGTVVEIHGLETPDAAARLVAAGAAGVTALADRQLVRAAEIAAELGYAFFSPDVATKLTVKHEQRNAMRAAGLAVPKFRLVAADLDAAQVEDVVGKPDDYDDGLFRFPAVLKPESGGGSRDTYLVGDVDELTERIRLIDAKQPRPPMIVEEYLVGRPDVQDDFVADYMSVEHVISNGTICVAGITGRVVQEPPFRETGTFMPALLGPADEQAVLELAEAAVRAVGVTVGCTHTEIKLTPDGPRVIEVNGRLGGGAIPALLQRIGGESLLRLVGQVAMGQSVHVERPAAPRGVAFLFALQPPMHARRLERLDGVPDLNALPGVLSVDLNLKVGDPIDWTHGTYDYLFTMVGVGDDHAGMRTTWDEMVRIVDAEYS
jgi:biotin carboxylase